MHKSALDSRLRGNDDLDVASLPQHLDASLPSYDPAEQTTHSSVSLRSASIASLKPG